MLVYIFRWLTTFLLGDYCWYRYGDRSEPTRQVFCHFTPDSVEDKGKFYFLIHIGFWFYNLQIIERGFYEQD